MPDATPEDRDVVPPHDRLDAPDAEDEADSREAVPWCSEPAGDGDVPRIRVELGLDDDET